MKKYLVLIASALVMNVACANAVDSNHKNDEATKVSTLNQSSSDSKAQTSVHDQMRRNTLDRRPYMAKKAK